MARRRKRILIAVAIALLAGFVLVYPWDAILAIGYAPLVVEFAVTDAETGAPVAGAHIDLHDELAGGVTILRTDEHGIATLNTECKTSITAAFNPISGVPGRSRTSPGIREWLVVMTAEGYRPPEPWRVDVGPRILADHDGSYEVSIPVSLVPHAPPS